MDLPDIPSSPILDHSVDLPLFPSVCPTELSCFVDAAHANDLRNRRSTTGFGCFLGGGVIAYRCKMQTVVATSSTEAEFIAAVSAAKTVKYLRMILSDLGFTPTGPTVIFEDNQSAIHMVNSGKPTDRSRHIDIAYFAIQDWKARGDIVMQHIAGIINPSDCLTKPVGWILHARHSHRLMGFFTPWNLNC